MKECCLNPPRAPRSALGTHLSRHSRGVVQTKQLLFCFLLILIFPLPCLAQDYTLVQGDLPILLVNPHGGGKLLEDVPIREKSTSSDPHFTRSKDLLTAELTRQLYNAFPPGRRPSMLLCHVHRKYVDMNRAPADAAESEQGKAIYAEFHRALQSELQRLVSLHGWALLLDIHGQRAEDFDLVIGTRGGTTLSPWGRDALWGPDGVVPSLRQAGFTISPDQPQDKIRLAGGNTVQHYAHPPEMEACQFEHGKNLRFDPARNAGYTQLLAKLLLKLVERHPQR